jgi:hypothetical protein
MQHSWLLLFFFWLSPLFFLKTKKFTFDYGRSTWVGEEGPGGSGKDEKAPTWKDHQKVWEASQNGSITLVMLSYQMKEDHWTGGELRAIFTTYDCGIDCSTCRGVIFAGGAYGVVGLLQGITKRD